MRKVAAIIPYKIFPYNSGGQKSIAIFYDFFSKKEPVTIICTSNNSKPAHARYQIAPLLGSSVLRYINPLLFFTLKSFIKKNNINTIILEHPYFGWLAYLLKKALQVKIIAHNHNIEGLRFKTLNKWWWKILWNYEKWVLSISDYSFFIQENDRTYAIENFGLNPGKTAVVTFGIDWNKPPEIEEREQAKQRLKVFHKLSEDERIILFNGAFDYKPNMDALQIIINKINPALQSAIGFKYKIIVCGRHIPDEMMRQQSKNVIFMGFVEDISLYYKGADIFINPVNDGGGIKTKLVEALAYNITSVSTINGAVGVDRNICNGKLLVTENEDWTSFASEIVKASAMLASIGKEFYDHFYWGNITDKAIKIISENS